MSKTTTEATMRCLVTGKPVDEPKVCTCRCANCWEYLCDLENAAYCPHGFLVGCPTCGA